MNHGGIGQIDKQTHATRDDGKTTRDSYYSDRPSPACMYPRVSSRLDEEPNWLSQPR